MDVPQVYSCEYSQTQSIWHEQRKSMILYFHGDKYEWMSWSTLPWHTWMCTPIACMDEASELSLWWLGFHLRWLPRRGLESITFSSMSSYSKSFIGNSCILVTRIHDKCRRNNSCKLLTKRNIATMTPLCCVFLESLNKVWSKICMESWLVKGVREVLHKPPLKMKEVYGSHVSYSCCVMSHSVLCNVQGRSWRCVRYACEISPTLILVPALFW